MKKLTAGIFATLLAVVSADSAYAAIASSGYVDEKVGEVSQTVTTLSGTVSGHTTSIGEIEGTMETYGDIVTHNVAEFATAAEGDLATTAVQPSDITNVERTTNRTQTVNAQSTDTQYPSAKAVWTAVSSVDANASVEALEGRVDTLETASATHATKTELSSGLAAKANTADLGDLAELDAVGSAQITDGAVATADIADKAVTEAKLSDTVNASLDKADSALQKTTADAAYAVKALETQVGTVSKENMGTTTATTVVGGVKEAIDAAKAADTKAAGAQSAVDTVEATIGGYGDIVTHNASEFATTGALTSGLAGKLDSDATAARATADASGNVITTTYATKEEIADMATDANLALKQDKTDNSLTTTSKTVVGAINEVKTTADDASTAAAAAQEDATQALADAATAQEAAEAAQSAAETAQSTADAKQDKLTGTIGGSMQPVYLNNGTITAGTALGTLATKSTVTNAEVVDGALAQSKISGLATSLAAKLTTPPTSENGETGLYVLTYDGTDFQWEDIARTVAE